MAKKQRNLVGQRFDKLTVIESCGKGKDGHYISKVKCECGVEYFVPDTELIYGRRTACKKCVRKTHGKTNTKLFGVWQSMKQRCCDKNKDGYKHYGGRGVQVCNEWQTDFMSFYMWAHENGYKENLTLDRIDNNGNYEPSNCRWVGVDVQANNKRSNRYIIYGGERCTIAELSRRFNIKQGTLRNRIECGWDIEKALTLPPKNGRNQYEKI